MNPSWIEVLTGLNTISALRSSKMLLQPFELSLIVQAGNHSLNCLLSQLFKSRIREIELPVECGLGLNWIMNGDPIAIGSERFRISKATIWRCNIFSSNSVTVIKSFLLMSFFNWLLSTFLWFFLFAGLFSTSSFFCFPGIPKRPAPLRCLPGALWYNA